MISRLWRESHLLNRTREIDLKRKSLTLQGSLDVHGEAERRFVLPHLSNHTVLPSQLIGKTVSGCVETRLPTPSPCLLSTLPWFLPGDFPSKIPRLTA